MFLAPKYFKDEQVMFMFLGHILEGTIFVVDKGIWEDMNNVYYDIIAPELDDKSKDACYKHIKEVDIIKKVVKN